LILESLFGREINQKDLLGAPVGALFFWGSLCEREIIQKLIALRAEIWSVRRSAH